MTPHVVDIYERGAAAKWAYSADAKIVCAPVVVGNLVGRRNQGAQATASYRSTIRRTH
jgi:hypothetical protein